MKTISGAELLLKMEQFVPYRLREFDSFGRSDIEVWLKEERNAEQPYFGPSLEYCLRNHDISDFGWNFYIWRMFNGGDCGVPVLPNCTHLEALQTYGAVVGEDMHKHAENYPLLYKENDLLSLFLASAKGRAYCLYNGFVFDFGDPFGVFTITFSPGGGEGRITYSRGVWPMPWMDSVLMNWSDCSDEEARIKARNFLCDCLERRMQLEREKAEAEFENAVAVSEDGSKIVSADRVVVSRYDGTIQLYDKDLFTENKILRSKNTFRFGDSFKIVTEEVARKSIQNMFQFVGLIKLDSFAHWQRYFAEVKMPDGRIEKWFWCNIGDDAFPEGGEVLLSK